MRQRRPESVWPSLSHTICRFRWGFFVNRYFPFPISFLPFICISLQDISAASSSLALFVCFWFRGERHERRRKAISLALVLVGAFFFARGRSFSGIRFVFRMLINSIAYKFWSRTFATSTHRHTHTCIYDTHTLYIPLMRWVCSPRSVVHFSFFLLFVFVVTVRSAFLLTIANQSHFSISLRLFRTHIDGVFTYVFMYCVCTRHMYVCMGVCGM